MRALRRDRRPAPLARPLQVRPASLTQTSIAQSQTRRRSGPPGRPNPRYTRSAKIGYVLLWLLGVPLPILLAIYVLRGCN